MTLEKTKEIYIKYEFKMSDICTTVRAAGYKETENVAAIELALREDKIFHKYGVEENELLAAVEFYKLDEKCMEKFIITVKEKEKEIL